jgi:hypothetical protein
MKPINRTTQFFLILALLAGLLGVLPAQPVQAASIVVNSDIDDDIFTTFANGKCELREAIVNANNDDQSGSPDCAAGSGADTITFATDYTITLYNQLPAIDSNITITGRGINNTIIQASEAPGVATYRVFLVDGDPLTLNHLTVRHGRCVDACGDGSNTSGGGIFVWGGILNLNNSAVLNNSANGFGGGIMLSGGEVHINNSSVAFNTASTGGGIGSSGVPGSFDISNSSIIANSASNTGGVYVNGPVTLTMANSTVSNNIATTTNPAGIQNDGTATITNSTIVSNDGHGLFASGIINGSGNLTLYNTIVANNPDGDDCGNAGTLTANSFNLDSDGTCGNATTKTSGELNLGGVGDNGGPTYTVPLLSGSHAIDAGDNATCPATDQRSIARPQGAGCDIGAFEFVTPTVLSIQRQSPVNQVVTSGNSLTFRVTFSKDVTGVDSNDFSLSLLSIPGANAVISGVTQISPSVYDVNVNISGLRNAKNKLAGALRLDMPDSAAISDLASNTLEGLPYVNGAVYSVVQGQTFPDVPASFWGWTLVERLFYNGLTSGYPDETYRPNNSVTRAEIAVLLLKAINGPGYNPPAVNATFSDTDNHWAKNWIEALKTSGITSGYPDGTYRPENSVSRAEISIFLLKAINGPGYNPPIANATFSDTDSHWAKNWIEALKASGITSGYPDGTFRPENSVNRAEIAAFIINAFGLP